MERLYSAEETADFLQIKTDTVRRYIRSGKIKAVKVGKAWRIKESDIRSFITPEDNEDQTK